MSKKYESFVVSREFRVNEIDGDMCINISSHSRSHNYAPITKQQAMDFFGLVEREMSNTDKLNVMLAHVVSEEWPEDVIFSDREFDFGCDEFLVIMGLNGRDKDA